MEDNTRKWGFVGGTLFLEIRKRMLTFDQTKIVKEYEKLKVKLNQTKSDLVNQKHQLEEEYTKK